MKKRIPKKLWVPAIALALCLAVAVPAFSVYFDGRFTNLLVNGKIHGVYNETLDNSTTDGTWTCTPAATGAFNITTGNLKVGNGTPGVTLNGEDAYVEGTFEVDGAVDLGSTVSVTGAITSLAASPFIFEGATADAFETTLAVADPTADRTITLPDYTGGVPLVIAQGWTQTSIDDVTAVDITGSSLTLADGWFTAGKTLKYVLGGTKTGANGTAMVLVYLDNSVITTLTSSGNTAGDWMAEIYVTEYTDTAHQAVMGKFIGADGVVTAFDVDTTDMNAGSAVTFKLQLDLGHADDAMTCDYIVIEHWNK